MQGKGRDKRDAEFAALEKEDEGVQKKCQIGQEKEGTWKKKSVHKRSPKEMA